MHAFFQISLSKMITVKLLIQVAPNTKTYIYILCFACGLAVVFARPLNQALSQEWRCSWSSADGQCSNYICAINNFIAHPGASYIRGLTACLITPRDSSLGARAILALYINLFNQPTCLITFRWPDGVIQNGWRDLGTSSIKIDKV